MAVYILIVLALFILQTYLAPSLRYATGGKKSIIAGMGGRDQTPADSVAGGRLARSVGNMKEALPIFLTLALLAEMKGVTGGLVETGAIIFIIGRILYIPAYLISFGPMRSIMWTVAFVGMVLMLVGIWPSLGI